MGFKQTDTHRFGKTSYHQIGLVRGQFGNVPMTPWVKFLQDTGFDGWEEASWELELDKCMTDQGAEAYAKERVDLAKKHGLEIFTIATHLQGQALGDEPSAKTLQFTRGEARPAYKAWRAKNQPPRTNPYFVPEEVGKLIHQQSQKDLIASARLAHYLGKLQNRRVALPGFVGSPAHCWSHFFLFPPLPSSLEGHAIPDARQVSLELLVERFGPFLDVCKKLGVTFDLECHPSERAMGDMESASDYINHMCKAGYEGVVGFNLDGSHMEWQGVSVVQFIREFGNFIHCAHIKGVQVSREHTRAGLLGGHRPMGHPLNGWNFVTAGTLRDANSVEEIFIELNRVGYDGAVSIEWEDNDAEQHAGAKAALANCRKADQPPSGMRHDEMLKA
ncbi:MAG: TIM barrel protein [Gemmataceae bacterium]|nr:TIM barrel protein [Gemmataceae bacterium]MCI0740528.1 TIM barrel protein [Gemmataceae bacterium]